MKPSSLPWSVPPTHTMGHAQSISRFDCVNLKEHLCADDFAKLVNEDYTVIRTNGEAQTGFRIPTEEHGCQKGSTAFCPAAHATRMSPSREPKFFMTTEPMLCAKDCIDNHEHNDHVCGWRVCSPKRRTFWPTRITEDKEKEAWFKWLDELVAPLPFPTLEDKAKEEEEEEREDRLRMEGSVAAIQREQQEKLTEDEQREKRANDLFYDRAQAAMKNMLKEEAEKVKAKTGCQCASVLDCKPCVYGAQGRPLDS